MSPRISPRELIPTLEIPRGPSGGKCLVALLAVALGIAPALGMTACDDGADPGDTRDTAVDITTDAADDQSSEVVVEGFDDHTVPSFDTVSEFESFAASSVGGQSVVKFVITRFHSAPALRFSDSNFYELHDEWYWFRLLNGESVPGSTTPPVLGLSFETIDEIYEWALDQPPQQLPLDLRFVGDERLYSPEFYTLALQPPRTFGVGSVIRVPERESRPETWVFELEYQDPVDHDALVVFFEQLEAGLPDDVGPRLYWVVRSPGQEELADRMEAEQLPYHDRVLRYDDLVVPGEVEVYSEGLAAGRVRVVRAGEGGLENSRKSDLLLLEQVPDWLPPAAALVTAVPQTPLAHVNVLARNRGIPNAYLGGLLDDPEIDQLARVRAPAIVHAVAPDQLDIVAMTEAQFREWRDLQTAPPIAVPDVDVETLDYVVDLEVLAATEPDEADLEALRPVIGGKAAGFLGLMAPGTLTIPDRPMVITVRSYIEHLAELQVELDAMLSDNGFLSSARTRFLLLEGVEDFRSRYSSPEDEQFRLAFFASHPAGTPLGDIVRSGGFKRMIRDTPIDPMTLSTIETTLQTRYADYATTQGLRFRSSSSVEDIEGFNGAGLYDSNTGFFEPLVQSDPDERKKSLAWAIKKTWASYWGFEAFEERNLESVNHTSGAMAVLVHARFDDPLEVDNGVFTFTILPESPPDHPDAPLHADRYVMELNVQDGAESVTNPTPGLNARPEIDIVRESPSGELEIERVGASSLVPEGERILDDSDLLQIYGQARDVTVAWRDRINAVLPVEEQIQTVTLDFEFREMAAGWPALSSGTPFEQRIVIKQARSLDPGLRRIPETLKALPFPRDLLARARRGERVACTAQAFRMTTAEVYTDPLASPRMGYEEAPFNGFISLEVLEARPALGLAAGERVVLPWTGFDATHPGMRDDGAWSLSVALHDGAATSSLASFAMHADGTYTLAGNGAEDTGLYTCQRTTLLTTPRDYLLELLDSAD